MHVSELMESELSSEVVKKLKRSHVQIVKMLEFRSYKTSELTELESELQNGGGVPNIVMDRGIRS